MRKITDENKIKECQEKDRQYNKMLREISYKDAGECFRKNMFWRIQGRVEVL